MPTYSPILDSEVDAESPITQSLMERLRDNPLAILQSAYTVLTGSGTYNVPADVTKLRCILVSGGGGGGDGGGTNGGYGGGGGGGGQVLEEFLTVTPLASLSYSCGAGGAGNTPGATAGGSAGGTTTFDSLSVAGGYGGGRASTSTIGIGGNQFAMGNQSWRADSDDGMNYYGGFGGNGADASGGTGYVAVKGNGYSPVKGDGGAVGSSDMHGGGGAPMILPFWIDGVDAYLGDGGAGGTTGHGSNATTYGAGGGGARGNDGSYWYGGNGSAGIIFVLPIG